MDNTKQKNVLMGIDAKSTIPYGFSNNIQQNDSRINNITINNVFEQLIDNDIFIENQLSTSSKYQYGPKKYTTDIKQTDNGYKMWGQSRDKDLIIYKKVDKELQETLVNAFSQIDVRFICENDGVMYIGTSDTLLSSEDGDVFYDCQTGCGCISYCKIENSDKLLFLTTNGIVQLNTYTSYDGTTGITTTTRQLDKIYSIEDNVDDDTLQDVSNTQFGSIYYDSDYETLIFGINGIIYCGKYDEDSSQVSEINSSNVYYNESITEIENIYSIARIDQNDIINHDNQYVIGVDRGLLQSRIETGLYDKSYNKDIYNIAVQKKIDNIIYVGTSKGLFQIDEKCNLISTLYDGVVTSGNDYNNTLYCGTGIGNILKCKSGSVSIVSTGLSQSITQVMAYGYQSDPNILFLTSSGSLYVIRNGLITDTGIKSDYIFISNGSDDLNCNLIYSYDKTLYIGCLKTDGSVKTTGIIGGYSAVDKYLYQPMNHLDQKSDMLVYDDFEIISYDGNTAQYDGSIRKMFVWRHGSYDGMTYVDESGIKGWSMDASDPISIFENGNIIDAVELDDFIVFCTGTEVYSHTKELEEAIRVKVQTDGQSITGLIRISSDSFGVVTAAKTIRVFVGREAIQSVDHVVNYIYQSPIKLYDTNGVFVGEYQSSVIGYHDKTVVYLLKKDEEEPQIVQISYGTTDCYCDGNYYKMCYNGAVYTITIQIGDSVSWTAERNTETTSADTYKEYHNSNDSNDFMKLVGNSNGLSVMHPGYKVLCEHTQNISQIHYPSQGPIILASNDSGSWYAMNGLSTCELTSTGNSIKGIKKAFASSDEDNIIYNILASGGLYSVTYQGQSFGTASLCSITAYDIDIDQDNDIVYTLEDSKIRRFSVGSFNLSTFCDVSTYGNGNIDLITDGSSIRIFVSTYDSNGNAMVAILDDTGTCEISTELSDVSKVVSHNGIVYALGKEGNLSAASVDQLSDLLQYQIIGESVSSITDTGNGVYVIREDGIYSCIDYTLSNEVYDYGISCCSYHSYLKNDKIYAYGLRNDTITDLSVKKCDFLNDGDYITVLRDTNLSIVNTNTLSVDQTISSVESFEVVDGTNLTLIDTDHQLFRDVFGEESSVVNLDVVTGTADMIIIPSTSDTTMMFLDDIGIGNYKYDVVLHTTSQELKWLPTNIANYQYSLARTQLFEQTISGSVDTSKFQHGSQIISKDNRIFSVQDLSTLSLQVELEFKPVNYVYDGNNMYVSDGSNWYYCYDDSIIRVSSDFTNMYDATYISGDSYVATNNGIFHPYYNSGYDFEFEQYASKELCGDIKQMCSNNYSSDGSIYTILNNQYGESLWRIDNDTGYTFTGPLKIGDMGGFGCVDPNTDTDAQEYGITTASRMYIINDTSFNLRIFLNYNGKYYVSTLSKTIEYPENRIVTEATIDCANIIDERYFIGTSYGIYSSSGQGDMRCFDLIYGSTYQDVDMYGITQDTDGRYTINSGSGLFTMVNNGVSPLKTCIYKNSTDADPVTTYQHKSFDDVTTTYIKSDINNVSISQSRKETNNKIHVDGQTIQCVYPKNNKEYYIGTSLNLYKTEYDYCLSNDVKQFTESDVKRIYDIIKTDLDDKTTLDIQDHIQDKHITDQDMEYINSNFLSVNFSGINDTSWMQTTVDDQNQVNVQNDIVYEIYYGEGGDGDVYGQYSNFLVSSDNAELKYILKRYTSGITEFYAYFPTTHTYYIAHPVGLPNCLTQYQQTQSKRKNLVGFGYNKATIDGNIDSHKTNFSVAITNSLVSIDDILNIEVNGNSLPLKIYKEEDTTADNEGLASKLYHSLILQSQVTSYPQTSADVNSDGDYIFGFQCFGQDAQAVKIMFLDKSSAQTNASFTVQFHSNGANGTMPNQRFVIGQKKTLRKCSFTWSSTSQKTFAGWTTNIDPDDNTDYEYADCQSFSMDQSQVSAGQTIHLYAVWMTYSFGDNDTSFVIDSNMEDFYIDNVKIDTSTNLGNTVVIDFGDGTTVNGSSNE